MKHSSAWLVCLMISAVSAVSAVVAVHANRSSRQGAAELVTLWRELELRVDVNERSVSTATNKQAGDRRAARALREAIEAERETLHCLGEWDRVRIKALIDWIRWYFSQDERASRIWSEASGEGESVFPRAYRLYIQRMKVSEEKWTAYYASLDSR